MSSVFSGSIPDFPEFWSDFQRFESRAAFIDSVTGEVATYADLMRLADFVSRGLPHSSKQLVAMRISPTIESLAIYIGILQAGHVVLLGSALAPVTVAAFKPDLIILQQNERSYAGLPGFASRGALLGHHVMAAQPGNDGAIHPAVALLIPTSGSTGARRYIKLSYRNIHAGALQVAKGLDVTGEDCAITNLPLDHVYGLSILHSHLKAGGRIVLERGSYLNPGFWDTFRKFRVTGLGGVPYTYQSLRETGFQRQHLPSLRTLTQAGGPLGPDMRAWLTRTFVPRGVAVYFMYGLSEATGRVAILQPAALDVHPGSVGVAVSHGELWLGENDEVQYRGPNVMLGYATGRADLIVGDTTGGILRTGDQGALSPDGHLYIKGRLSRFAKVFGKRVSLDELEDEFACGSILCLDASEDRLNVYHNGSDAAGLDAQVTRLCKALRVPPQAVRSWEIGVIPRTENGKIDYHRLMAMAKSRPAGA